MSKTMIDPTSINADLLGGVVVIDIQRCNNPTYVKRLYDELRKSPAIVIFKESDNICRVANTVSITSGAVVVNHYYTDSQKNLVKHNHNFKIDGSYSLSVISYPL